MSMQARGASAVAMAALALAGVGVIARTDGGPHEVTVVARYSRFSPAVVSARAGETIRFTVVNDDPIAHEFVLGDEAEQRRHERGSDATHDGTPGAASLEPGERQVVTYRVARAGTVLFGCHLPGHYAYGMKGEVRVRA